MRAPSSVVIVLSVLLAGSALQLHCASPAPPPAASGPSVSQPLAKSAPSVSSQAPAVPLRKPDVPYEPSSDEAIAAMIRLGRPSPSDVVYDLGCGDGRVVIQAVKQTGAKGVCVDIDPVRIQEARENAARAGVSERMQFRTEDLFATDIRDANVVMLFLWPEINLRLLPKLLSELAPGTRIVSNMHDMGAFAPEQVIETKSPRTGEKRGVYLWRVPARPGY